MATAVNEQIITGRAFRKLIDQKANKWLRESFWTAASDVELNDGDTVENKLMSLCEDICYGNVSFEVREDGVYITYVPKGGADSVTKKLGSYDLIIACLTDLGYPPDGDEEEDMVEAIKRLAEGKFREGLEQSTGQGNVKIVYTYHKHVTSNGSEYNSDNAIYGLTSPGGCYVSAGHTHNQGGLSCPQKTRDIYTQCKGGATCSQGPLGPDTSGQQYYVGDCNVCGTQYNSYSKNAWIKCTETTYAGKETYYDCNEQTNTWKPNCGRNAGKTVDRVEMIYCPLD